MKSDSLTRVDVTLFYTHHHRDVFPEIALCTVELAFTRAPAYATFLVFPLASTATRFFEGVNSPHVVPLPGTPVTPP